MIYNLVTKNMKLLLVFIFPFLITLVTIYFTNIDLAFAPLLYICVLMLTSISTFTCCCYSCKNNEKKIR